MAWGRRTGADGLVTAMTPAVTPAEVAVVLDPDAPAGRYRAFGLVVGVDLPHPHENAQLVTLDDAAMDAALARLERPAAR